MRVSRHHVCLDDYPGSAPNSDLLAEFPSSPPSRLR
jgi:hypothetical protein